jgi:Uma2 family endonuclease
VGEIWLIDAEQRQFEAHAREGNEYTSRVLTTGRWEPVALPGLTVDIDWFWQSPLPSVSQCRLGW